MNTYDETMKQIVKNYTIKNNMNTFKNPVRLNKGILILNVCQLKYLQAVKFQQKKRKEKKKKKKLMSEYIQMPYVWYNYIINSFLFKADLYKVFHYRTQILLNSKKIISDRHCKIQKLIKQWQRSQFPISCPGV